MQKVAALYKFVYISDPQFLSDTLLQLCKKHRILGALIIAHEGINGTIAGSASDMDAFILEMTDNITELSVIEELKFSEANDPPFYRIRVRVKPEIVTMGRPEVNPAMSKGQYIEAKDWNALITDPEVVVIDTRNSYEVELGSFARSLDPKTRTFREFPDYVDSELNATKQRKVAMFCTGGVRCEKASAYMLHKGFENVYHLKGGILKYLETVPEADSLWTGECFVFDQRAAVGNGVTEGNYEFCRSCRHPITIEDKMEVTFEDGVSCVHCHESLSSKKRDSARERNLQMRIAEERNLKHLGFEVTRSKLLVGNTLL